jgi:hypothetical protein
MAYPCDGLGIQFSCWCSRNTKAIKNTNNGVKPDSKLSDRMKTIKFAAFLFYRYYSGGRRPDSTPFFRTKLSMTLLGFMHLMQLLVILDKVNDYIPTSTSYGRGMNKIIMFFVMLPIYFLVSLLIKKKDMDELDEKYAYDWDKVFNGNVWLVVYIIVSFALIFVLAIWKKH